MRRTLRDLADSGLQNLQPVLVPVPFQGPAQFGYGTPPSASSVHLAFGRKKDSKDDEDGDDSLSEDSSGADSDPDPEQLPPIPSALGAAGLNPEPDEEAATEDEVGAWRPLDSRGEEDTTRESPAPAAGEPVESDLPAWSTRSFQVPESPSSADTGLGQEPAPWGSAGTDDEPATFTPAVVDPKDDHPDNLAWLQSGSSGETAPWAVQSEPPAEEVQTAAVSDPEPVAELDEIEEIDEVDEIEPETPQEEEALGTGSEGLDSFSEVLTGADEPWTSPTTVLEEAVIYQPAQEVSVEPSPAQVSALQTRSFPLPEGEVVFRNLRAGFTDPARLLRHLAGEGHTGVLHVQGVDGSNSYVVLVDGYVVAVASDRQGNITTTNRISFPNFPNSQDTINVITYSRQIARGLGLVLHAPLRFAGLGAMFVNLEGLRSYLSKYSSSGGLIVHAQDGIGVALFEDGKLVGAYANGNAPTSDLGQLRDLVKDLEAEIDVRFGGPQDLEPTPLDTLLSGHPL
ncbi:MAG: hypothetical protein ACRENX_03595 [Candidatus Dormibacteria bacterium]